LNGEGDGWEGLNIGHNGREKRQLEKMDKEGDEWEDSTMEREWDGWEDSTIERKRNGW
jgi:hypothetical protein